MTATTSPPTIMPTPSTLRVRNGRRLIYAIYFLAALKLLLSVFLTENKDSVENSLSIAPKFIDAMLLLVGIIGLAIAPSTLKKWKIIALLTALTIFGALSQIASNRSLVEGITILSKLVMPFMLLSALILSNYKIDVTPISKKLAWWVVSLILIGLVYVEPSFRNGQEWLPAYFSGTHTSAYIAIFSTALLLITRNTSPLHLAVLLPSLFLLSMAFIGWGVRTAFVASAIAFIYVIAKALPSQHRFLILIGSIAAIAISSVAIYSVGLIDSDGLEEISSGRTTEWLTRIATIGDRSLIELLIGTGFGSNVTFSDVWWWEEKDSHNDFLAVAYEQGLVGLLLLIMLIHSALKLNPSSVSWNSVWIMYIVNSSLSNGIMFRPTASTIFVIAAFAAHNSITKKRSR